MPPDPTPRRPRTAFDVVIKVSEACNLACDYCYYYFQEYDGNKNPPSMSDEVISELPRFLARSVDALNFDQLGIVLHGGEPLIMKKARFDRLCRTLRETLQGRIPFRLALQTNGTLIDDEWIDIFAEHQIHVGVSIDGPKLLHDRRRLDHRGRGSYDACVRGLRMLQSAVEQGRLKGAGALAVVYADGSDKVLQHLVQQLQVLAPNLNFPRGGWDNPEAVNWNKALESHRVMTRYAFDTFVSPRFRKIRGLTTVLLNLVDERGARHNDDVASMHHFIATVSSDGVIYPDDNLLGVDPNLSESDLRIFGTSLRDFVESPTFSRLTEAADSIPDECSKCEWFRSCRSGELYDRYARESGYARPSVFCETIKMVHDEAFAYLARRGIVNTESVAEILSKRADLTSADLVARLLAEKREPGAADPD